MKESITFENLKFFADDFSAEKSNVIAMNAVAKNGINESAQGIYAGIKYPHSFSIEIDAGDVCNQRKSGRCWMFAALNVMRLDMMKKLNLGNTELSQNYTLFWDKLEKSNYFLENIIETLNEPLSSRTLAWLLADPVGDGGQWDMFRSVIAKYGIVPQNVMPDTESAMNTGALRKYLTLKLREFACTLRDAHEAGESLESLRAMKDDMLSTVYRILSIALGEPPKTFTWETRDKDNKFVRIENITPQEFFERYIGWNLDEYITVINAPTADKPFNRSFTVKHLGTVRGGKYPVKYLNLPVEELKRITIEQLKNGEVVWFGSDVGQFSSRELGLLAFESLDVAQLLGTDFPMSKAQRLDYGESLMTHAMVITGVNLDENGKPNRWKVENSWGKDVGKNGYYVMSDEWFSEFVYQILLKRSYLSDEQLACFDAEPIELSPWDPMGSLAL